jgi:hypothetical protein
MSLLLALTAQVIEVATAAVGGIGKSKGKAKKRWIERDGKILIFDSADNAEQYVSTEKSTVKPAQKVKAKKVISKPVDIIDKKEIKRLSSVYQYQEKLYQADQLGNIELIVALYKEMQRLEEQRLDDEEIEILLMSI